jgi:hypothetical protein
MSSSTKIKLPEYVSYKMVREVISVIIGAPLELEDNECEIEKKYVSFVSRPIINKIDYYKKRLEETKNEVKDYQLKNPESIQDNKSVPYSIRIAERNLKEAKKDIAIIKKWGNKVKSITGEESTWMKAHSLHYPNIYLNPENYEGYSIQGQVHTCFIHKDEVMPENMKIGTALNPEANPHWIAIGIRLVEFFGGKIIFNDVYDEDTTNNYLIIELNNAVYNPLKYNDEKEREKHYKESIKKLKLIDFTLIEKIQEKGFEMTAQLEAILKMTISREKQNIDDMIKSQGVDLSGKKAKVKKF